MWIALATLLATFVASFTDWLFMDLLVHRYYEAEPAVWRPSNGSWRIIFSQIVGTVATAAAVLLCAALPGRPVFVALATWGAGALPMCVQNVQWMRLHPAIGASHAAGWLARLLLATFSAALLLPRH